MQAYFSMFAGVALSSRSINTTDPGHSAWRPRLSHRFTLLCQELRYLKPQREHHLRPAVTELTTAPCPPVQVLQHPWALYTFLPTRTVRTSCSTQTKPPTKPPPPLPQAVPGLQMRRLQRGNDARRRRRTFIYGQGFHPESPALQRTWRLAMVPQ